MLKARQRLRKKKKKLPVKIQNSWASLLLYFGNLYLGDNGTKYHSSQRKIVDETGEVL